MPQVRTTTHGGNSNTNTTTTAWKWSSFLTPQIFVYAGIATVWLVTFALTQKQHTNDIKSLSQKDERRYEVMEKMLDRIISLEKRQEYETGFSEGEREERRRQRYDTGGRRNN